MSGGYPTMLQALHERYFVSPDPSGKYASSHWRTQHARLRVSQGKSAYTVEEASGFGYETRAFSTQMVLSWVSVLAHLALLPNKARLIRLALAGMRVARKMEHPFTIDCFRHCCVFALLEPYLSGRRVLIIGDGIGFLSLLIRELRPDARLTLVDLGKTLFIQALHAAKARPDDRVALVGESSAHDADILFCPAEALGQLSGHRFDLAINTNSMQEMHPDVVAEYFSLLRLWLPPSGLFYCSNREEKALPSGEILRFLEYPWQEDDEHLLDAECPWSRFFLSPGKCARGPSAFGVRVPFVQYYDGITRHRLSKLAPARVTTGHPHL